MDKQTLKVKIRNQAKQIAWRAITTVILTLTAVVTVWVYAAFVEPGVGPNSSDQDFAQNILGNNDANNDFSSSSVVANADGSLIERDEYTQTKIGSSSDATTTPAVATSLFAALKNIDQTRNHIQVFTASGTWVRPSNVNMVWVTMVGGGGGGGVGTSGNYGGGGGGSGATIYKFPVYVSANQTVTIGTAGSGGPTGGGVAATNGGNTSFGSIVAYGGERGKSAWDGGNGYGGAGGGLFAIGGGGAGGVNGNPATAGTAGSAFTFGFAGSGGGGGTNVNGGVAAAGGGFISGGFAGGAAGSGYEYSGGGGGSSLFGSGGRGGYNPTSNVTGEAGSGYGSGGGGGAGYSGTHYSGGAGKAGLAIVEWNE